MICNEDEDDPFPVDDCLFADTFCQDTVYSLCGQQLRIRQVFGGNLGVAAPVWEAALQLCRYFEEQSVELRGKRVIELGAGTGVVGILAACMGAVVTLTDLPLALPQLQANVSANMPPSGWPNTQPTVLPLSWGEDQMNFSSDWELILGTDIVYLPETYPLLVETLAHLCKSGGLVYLSSKMREEHGTHRFYEDYLPGRFKVDLVHRDEKENMNIYRASLKSVKMELWTENQGRPSLYSKPGTVPGRNFAHNYNDRHQETHYPLYYSVQQDQGRESSYWTAQGSRTGGTPHEYTNWTDQDLTSLVSSQFPFVLDHHPQQHRDLGEYQQPEARGRDWAATQRAARDYDGGYPREGWQKRWELCSPIRYNCEISTKRNDSSYRELEAWALRYSHSLPRRKRMEAGLRGASQSLLESRDSSRGITDPRVAALQQVIQSANIRESGHRDRGGRQQGPNHYPLQTSARDTSHMLDMKEKVSYQGRMFSQPPGYIAPPPYNSSHKSSPELHQCDSSLEKEGKRQSQWSQVTPQKQFVAGEQLGQRKVEKEDCTQADGNQNTHLGLEGLKQRQHEKDAFQPSSADSTETTNIQHEDLLSPQQPQILPAVQKKRINEDSFFKVIEGRKFRLNKKTGGMTIFCLVSRIAGTSETPSLPLCASQANIQNTKSGEVSKNLENNDDQLADEVDFKAPTLREQSVTPDSRSLQDEQKETPTFVHDDTLVDNQSNESVTSLDNEESSFTRQVSQSMQPVSVKYPLWREPGLASRAEIESPVICSKTSSEEAKSDDLPNQKDSGRVHPIDIEVRRLDITKATESEDSNDLLVIDTTCVLVKMELIPSPKKEHVHYLHLMPNTENIPPDISLTTSTEAFQSKNHVRQEGTTDQNAKTNPLQLSEGLETQPDSDPKEKLESDTEISFPTMMLSMPSLVPNRETLAERAERILGIPFQDCIIDQQPAVTSSRLDLFLENQEVDTPPTEDNSSCETDEQIKDSMGEKENSQNPTEVSQTEEAVCLQEKDNDKDQEDHNGDQDIAASQEHLSSEETETDNKYSFQNKMTESPLLGSTNGEYTTEKDNDDDQPVEDDNLPQYSAPSPAVSSLTETLAHQLPPPPPLLTLFAQSSTSHIDQSPNISTSIDQMVDALSTGAEDNSISGNTSQPQNDEIFNSCAKDMREVSEAHFESEQLDDTSCVKDSGPLTKQADEDASGRIMDNTEEFYIFQQQSECVQEEEIKLVKERHVAEEQPPKEVSEDLTDQISREQQPKESTEGPEIVSQKTVPTDIATNTQTQLETKNTQDIKPLIDAPDSSPPSPHFEVSPSHLDILSSSELPSPLNASNKPDNELVSLLEVDSVSPLVLSPNVDAVPAEAIPETFPFPFTPESCEDLQLPSSSDLPQVLSLSSLPPLKQDEGESDAPDLTLKELPQYPRSLWDAVNRIRKHTAPDSENEEEEVSELWDPESKGEGGTENMKAKRIDFDEAGNGVSTVDGVDEVQEGQTKQSPEKCGPTEEDTLSCSSTSSHSSGDTVIGADEEEGEEIQHDTRAEISEQNYEEGQKAEGE
ncbi:uncharacterized protein si:ch211-159e12.5 isoform X1 [Xyrichtys novacula]|uniref:Uncharacterized protein si:ch211-159e12.5 isoform X1 n=1 Tax=Xyrichtys novacula TaxID=13765 RepID=A0AAV1ESB8_XYRNO|nr:uncharacterized protein si:ch211-159e12.5 isoform X1 [Xyrichtys novacula]